MDHFLNLYWIYYNIASTLCFGFLGSETCGILALKPGGEPTSPALEGDVLTTGPPTREAPSHWSFGVHLLQQLPSLLLNFIYISLVQTSILNIQLKFLIATLSFNRPIPNIFQELFPGPSSLNWVLVLCVPRALYLYIHTLLTHT